MTKQELMDKMSREGRSVLKNDAIYAEYLEYAKDPSWKALADPLSKKGRSILKNDSIYTDYLNLYKPVEEQGAPIDLEAQDANNALDANMANKEANQAKLEAPRSIAQEISEALLGKQTIEDIEANENTVWGGIKAAGNAAMGLAGAPQRALGSLMGEGEMSDVSTRPWTSKSVKEKKANKQARLDWMTGNVKTLYAKEQNASTPQVKAKIRDLRRQAQRERDTFKGSVNWTDVAEDLGETMITDPAALVDAGLAVGKIAAKGAPKIAAKIAAKADAIPIIPRLTKTDIPTNQADVVKDLISDKEATTEILTKYAKGSKAMQTPKGTEIRGPVEITDEFAGDVAAPFFTVPEKYTPSSLDAAAMNRIGTAKLDPTNKYQKIAIDNMKMAEDRKKLGESLSSKSSEMSDFDFGSYLDELEFTPEAEMFIPQNKIKELSKIIPSDLMDALNSPDKGEEVYKAISSVLASDDHMKRNVVSNIMSGLNKPKNSKLTAGQSFAKATKEVKKHMKDILNSTDARNIKTNRSYRVLETIDKRYGTDYADNIRKLWNIRKYAHPVITNAGDVESFALKSYSSFGKGPISRALYCWRYD